MADSCTADVQLHITNRTHERQLCQIHAPPVYFAKYKTPASKTDLSQIFLEKVFDLLHPMGLAAFICTSQWVSTDYGEKMRGFLGAGLLKRMIDFGSLPVFQRVSTYPAIFLVQKKSQLTLEYVRIIGKDQLNLKAVESVEPKSIHFSSLSSSPWNFSGFRLSQCQAARDERLAPLSTIGHFYIGALTGMDAVFVVTKDQIKTHSLESDLLLPYAYRGEEIERFSIVKPIAKIIYPYTKGGESESILIPESELRNKFPKTYAYLRSHQQPLRKRQDSRGLYAAGSEWYRFLRPGSFAYIEPSKLIIKGLARSACVGLLGENTCFNGANCPGLLIGKTDPLFLLGVLNSSLISFHLRSTCPAKLQGYRRFNANNLNEIPVPKPDYLASSGQTTHGRMVSLVDQMLTFCKKLAAAKTPHDQTMLQRQIDATDQQIDQMVYELYGLTAHEIKIVEEATAAP